MTDTKDSASKVDANIGNVGTAPKVDDEGKVQDHPSWHYCPGCGLRYQDAGTCTGTAQAPHPPIDTVSVKELAQSESEDVQAGNAPPKHHTAAPNTGE